MVKNRVFLLLVLGIVLFLSIYSAPAFARNNCYAKALPNKGHGGHAWASSLSTAKSMALSNCHKYAGQTGGNPNTCKIVEAHCNN